MLLRVLLTPPERCGVWSRRQVKRYLLIQIFKSKCAVEAVLAPMGAT